MAEADLACLEPESCTLVPVDIQLKQGQGAAIGGQITVEYPPQCGCHPDRVWCGTNKENK